MAAPKQHGKQKLKGKAEKEQEALERYFQKTDARTKQVAELREALEKSKYSWQTGVEMTLEEIWEWEEAQERRRRSSLQRLTEYSKKPVSPRQLAGALILELYGWKGLEGKD